MNNATGTVKWFSDQKGFGFIESNGEDFFAHFKSIRSLEGFKTLKEGQKVKFNAVAGKKGMEAQDITLI